MDEVALLRAEFLMSRQTAYTYMRVAARFCGSCKTVLQLPAWVLYSLASASDAIMNHDLATARQQVGSLHERNGGEASEHAERERIRLNRYRITGEFQRSLRGILSRWPSPLDVDGSKGSEADARRKKGWTT